MPDRAALTLAAGHFYLHVIPDGNNIEAVFHGEAERSAPSVKLTFPAP